MSTVSPGLTFFRSLPSKSYSPSFLIIPREVDAFCSTFSLPRSYLITVFGCLCFDVIRTRRYVNPLSGVRVIAVRRVVVRHTHKFARVAALRARHTWHNPCRAISRKGSTARISAQEATYPVKLH